MGAKSGLKRDREIAKRFKEGESIADLARAYSTERDDIEYAIRRAWTRVSKRWMYGGAG